MSEKKRGRPLKDGSKRKKVDIRFDDYEFEELSYIAEKYNMSRSDLIRKATEEYISKFRIVQDNHYDLEDYANWDEYEE